MTSEQGDLEQILSRAFGRDVTVEEARPGGGSPAATAKEYWPDMAGLDYRDTVTNFEMPAGTFFDIAVVHLLTTATINHLRALYPQGRFEIRRFRPNIVVSTSGEAARLPVPNGARWPMVDRRTVFHVAERATEPLGAAQTLVAASVWGSGTGGYARHRTLRVFENDGDEVGDRLAVAAQLLRADGPVMAYDHLHGDGRNLVPHLGPSFGTKVLYFSGYGRSHGDRQPLILDRYVALALNRLCRLDWPAHGWTTAQYAEYLGLAHSWANAWHTSPDVIERVLFSVGKASRLVVGVFTGLPLLG